jgi:hypothetical protein
VDAVTADKFSDGFLVQAPLLAGAGGAGSSRNAEGQKIQTEVRRSQRADLVINARVSDEQIPFAQREYRGTMLEFTSARKDNAGFEKRVAVNAISGDLLERDVAGRTQGGVVEGGQDHALN